MARCSRRAAICSARPSASLASRPRSAAGRPGPVREDGRVVVSFWYAYGDLVRKVLLDLVAQFNASQSRVVVKAVHQGDYFESLAKLRTAIAAKAAPALLSHVVLEVLPYLARAGVLEPLDGYEGAGSFDFVPALDQRGSFAAPSSAADADREPLYGIPFNRSTPIVFANGRWLERERVEMPRTWDELAAAASRLTQPERRRRRPVGIRGAHLVVVLGRDGRTGGWAHRRGLTDASRWAGPAGEEALRFWQRLVEVDRVMRPPPGRDYQACPAIDQRELPARARGHHVEAATAYVRYLEGTARFPVVAAPLPSRIRASVPTGGTMFVPDARGRGGREARGVGVRSLDVRGRAGDRVVDAHRVHADDPLGGRASDRERLMSTSATPSDRVAYDQLAADGAVAVGAQDLFRVERDVVEPRLEEAVLTGRDAGEVMAEARADAANPG